MPAYAPNYTPRLRIKYRAALATHTQTWRFPTYGVGGAGLIAASAAVQAFYDDLAPIMYDDWQILDTSWAQIDTDIFLPTTPLVVAGAVATPTTDPSIKAGACSFVGRTAAGQPAKVAQFGVAVPASLTPNAGDFRINAGEDANIDTAIAELNGFIAGFVICGSDGETVSWKPYANFKDYDYWVKRVRTGS